jgi:hypothetical protein
MHLTTGWRMEMENPLKHCAWLCGGFVMHSRNKSQSRNHMLTAPRQIEKMNGMCLLKIFAQEELMPFF